MHYKQILMKVGLTCNARQKFSIFSLDQTALEEIVFETYTSFQQTGCLLTCKERVDKSLLNHLQSMFISCLHWLQTYDVTQ